MHKISNNENKIIFREMANDIGLNSSIAFRKKVAAQYGSRVDKAIEKLARKNGFRFKKDWLALETLKDLQNKKNFWGKLFNFVHDKNAFITVIVLSLTSNAFIVTAYMRKGSFQYNGLTKRDWNIFLSSSLLTNLYWVFLIAGGIEIIKYLYQVIVNVIKGA